MRLDSATILASSFLALTLLAPADRATAEPTPDQVSAIKANCRSDFLSNCRGVPRGGSEAVQCLKNNFANVSPGCQQALKPLMAAAPAKKAPAPAPAPVAKPESTPAPAPPPAPETTAKTPATPESKPAAAVTPPAAPASEPAPAAAPKAAAKTPDKPAAPATPPAKQPAAAPAAAPAASAPAPVIIGRLPPRKKLMVLRNCRKELDTYCGDVDYGDGRQLQCLFSHKASLSSDCQGVLAKLTD